MFNKIKKWWEKRQEEKQKSRQLANNLPVEKEATVPKRKKLTPAQWNHLFYSRLYRQAFQQWMVADNGGDKAVRSKKQVRALQSKADRAKHLRDLAAVDIQRERYGMVIEPITTKAQLKSLRKELAA